MDDVEVVLVDKRLEGQLAYGSKAAAGIDLRACSIELATGKLPLVDGEAYVLYPGEQVKVGSGVKIHIGSMLADNQDYCEGLTVAGMLLPRSGLGTKHRLRLSNTVGLIDADYQGEIVMVLENGGTEPFKVSALERLAQLVLVPVIRVGFTFVPAFSCSTERGEGGFGSTGKQ